MDNDSRAGGPSPDGNRPALERWRQVEFERLVVDIAARLRKACAHLSDDAFANLVLEIAGRRMRFDAMDPLTGRSRPDE